MTQPYILHTFIRFPEDNDKSDLSESSGDRLSERLRREDCGDCRKCSCRGGSGKICRCELLPGLRPLQLLKPAANTRDLTECQPDRPAACQSQASRQLCQSGQSMSRLQPQQTPVRHDSTSAETLAVHNIPDPSPQHSAAQQCSVIGRYSLGQPGVRKCRAASVQGRSLVQTASREYSGPVNTAGSS